MIHYHVRQAQLGTPRKRAVSAATSTVDRNQWLDGHIHHRQSDGTTCDGGQLPKVWLYDARSFFVPSEFEVRNERLSSYHDQIFTILRQD